MSNSRNHKTDSTSRNAAKAERAVYPFTAIVGQEEMKLALLLNVVDPLIGGVLIFGHRGTGKSTAVRALADLLPQITRVKGCLYSCNPDDKAKLCSDCAARLAREGRLPHDHARVSVVDLPLGATEDRVCGTLDIERALIDGIKSFEPGLLARANRGFLYIDEVNLLEDHLVDLLLDAAASATNTVEREGISITHPSRFVLVGSGNPEEGELRPQLLDRFGLYTEITTITDINERIEIIERRDRFEREPDRFQTEFRHPQTRLRQRLSKAKNALAKIDIDRNLLRCVAELCVALHTDGHRGELTIVRAGRALAALEGRSKVIANDVKRVAVMALRHRLRKDPLDRIESQARIKQALETVLGEYTNYSDSRRQAR